MTEIINHIKTSFNNKIEVHEKRPGIMQLYLPIFHEDGDMVDVYIQQTGKNKYYLSDFGKTLQRLSYSYDIDTPNKEAILDKILLENSLEETKGTIGMETHLDTLFSDILHVTQVYAKIASMRYFKREVIESMFIDILEEFIFNELGAFNPEKNVYPIADKPEFEVDYSFTPNGHSVYLMGIKHPSQAKLAVINFQQFRLNKLNFRGWVVYESFDTINKNDIKKVTDASEKQFSSLDNFKTDIKYYLEKERK